MTDDIERWCELADAEAAGETLSAEEQAFLREHALDHEHASEQALFADIGRLGEPEPVLGEDRRRAEATLLRFRAEQETAAGSRWGTVSLAVVLAAAASLLAWMFVSPKLAEQRDTLARTRVAHGTFVLAGDELAAGDALPTGEWVSAKAGSCIDIDDARACFDGASELRVGDGAIDLRAGTMHVVSGSVMLADGERMLGEGESFTATPPAPEVVRAVPPSPPTSSPAPTPIAAPVVTPPSEVPTRKPIVREDRSKSASQMLAEARALANAGALGRAVAAYDALRRAHPESADANAANVSIGELQLRRGRAREALRAFERYLQRGGGLAEEARWGRVRALDTLGKTAARDRAIDQLVAAHPHSVYAKEAKAMRAP